MFLHKGLLLAAVLILGNGFCSENEAVISPDQHGSSQADNDAGIDETIAQIANDPGAGFGGDR